MLTFTGRADDILAFYRRMQGAGVGREVAMFQKLTLAEQVEVLFYMQLNLAQSFSEATGQQPMTMEQAELDMAEPAGQA